MTLWWLLPIVIAFSFALTAALRRYALARSLIDIPNARSSHSVPTPRGGGVAIALTFLLALPLWSVTYALSAITLWALLGAGAWVALIGFLDDHRHIPARWRLLAHFVGAAWVLAWLGGLPPVSVFGVVLDLGWLGYLLAAVYLVWLLNLYNFMDGIDGIAGIETITVCLGGAVLYGLSQASGPGWMLPLFLLAAVAGFLFWNFPKARIFMGDTGSGFVGIILGALSIQGGWAAPELFWGWIILLGAFIVDSTVTLLRRVWRGNRFHEAHRSHAYQYASRRFDAHAPISIAFGLVNLIWLLPVAALVAVRWLDGALGVMIAYLPLIWLAVRFKAGAAELQEV